MTERLPVYVDMDGVLADFDGEVERRLLAIDSTIDVSDRSSDFYITRRLKDDRSVSLAREIQASQGFFASLQPIEGAKEAWMQLEAAGMRPRVLSAPLSSNLWCIAEKLAWLDMHYGPKVADLAKFDKDKWRYNGVALIDDRPEISGASDAKWQHIIFSQAYNRHVDTEFRLENWQDPELLRLIARCSMRHSRISGSPLL